MYHTHTCTSHVVTVKIILHAYITVPEYQNLGWTSLEYSHIKREKKVRNGNASSVTKYL